MRLHSRIVGHVVVGLPIVLLPEFGEHFGLEGWSWEQGFGC